MSFSKIKNTLIAAIFALFISLSFLAIEGEAALWDTPVRFANPIKGVHTASQPISGAAWIETGEGVVVIDTLTIPNFAADMMRKIKERGGTVKYIIYTHGHPDHVGGASAFLEDKPEIIANKYLPDRLDKYNYQAEHRARITAEQFNVRTVASKKKWVYPTQTFLGVRTIKLGSMTFELNTALGETDDVCWVWVPELKTAFIGDLLIGSFPNVGNPWKPTRMALRWAKTLEEVRAKNPEHIFYNGAAIHRSGEDALEVLDDTIEAIRTVFDQVIDYINKGVHITEMIHMVKLPDHLKDKPHLRFAYSRLEFFVFNTYRWYHGYFDGNPANLLPRPEKEVMAELMKVIGDPQKVLDKAEALYQTNQAQLGLEVLDVLIQAEPENVKARQMRMKLLKKIRRGDNNLMSRNAYTTFIARDRVFLVSKGVLKAEKKEVQKPYLFEHEEEPVFSALIPGEFVKQKSGGNQFSARAGSSTLSISVNKLEENLDLSQAAQGYADVLKRIGDGKAELGKVTETKLPDGTPAVEFVIKWATKNGVPLTTQALTVYKGGYSISMGTHTWAGNLPDKKILYSITFK
jgi:glyoxylase-like metal-dependent hydrolase (beta-lactamase superfamily II)